MVSTVLETIGTTGRDYSTVAAWEAATDNDLVSDDEVRVGSMFDDSDFVEDVTIGGATTDSTRYRRLVTGAGQKYDPGPKTGVQLTASANNALTIENEDYIRVLGGMRLGAGPSAGTPLRIISTAGFVRCYALYLEGHQTTVNNQSGMTISANGSGNDHFIFDCIAVGSGANNTGFKFGFSIEGPSELYNCVAYECTRGSGVGFAADGAAGATIRNCIGMGSDTDFAYHSSPTGTISNNCSADATADDQGSNHLINQTDTDIFVAPGSQNFHLKDGSNAIDAGVDLSSLFTADYEQNTHGSNGTWDMGIFDRVTVNVTPTGIASAEAFGSATLNATIDVSPSAIASVEAFGSATLNATIDVTPTGIASAEAFGTATLNAIAGAQQIDPTAIASAEAFGLPTVQPGTVNLSPTAIASAEAFGSATLQPGQVSLSPSAIASAEAFGSATLNASIDVSPSAIASAEAFGSATLQPGTVNISPGAIASAEAFGTPTVSAAGAVQLFPSAIASAEAFGSATLQPGQVTVSPGAIASSEAFGSTTVQPGLVTMSPTSIASAEAFGAPTLQPGTANVGPTGIASAEVFGTPSLSMGVSIVVQSIASAEAFGTPTLTLQVEIISPTGIASAEAFGIAQLLILGQGRDVLPLGIASAEAFGYPFLQGGVIPMTLKTAIENALCNAAVLGSFYAIVRDPNDPCNVSEGLQIQPASIETNEVSSVYAVERRYGRDYKQDRRQWQWLLILRFQEEAITEPFEKALLDEPIVIPRDVANGIDRQTRLLLLDSRSEHPPREGASNGTEVSFRFQAELCPI